MATRRHLWIARYLFIGGTVVCMVAAAAMATAPSELLSNNRGANNKTVARVQARISLESKSLDVLDEERGDGSKSHLLDGYESGQTSSTTTTGGDAREAKKKTKKKAKEGRRLSNIWSMFLPGGDTSNNADSADYEESADEVETTNSESIATTTERPASAASDTSTQSPSSFAEGNSSIATTETTSGPSSSSSSAVDQSSAAVERNDERLVGKFMRPPPSRSEGGGSGDPVTTAPRQLPVHLITGALSKVENEVWPSTASAAPAVNFEGERENSPENRPQATPGEAAEDNNFERWLNRIKFKDSASSSQPPTGSPQQINAATTTTTPSPMRHSSGQRSKLAFAEQLLIPTKRQPAATPHTLNSTQTSLAAHLTASRRATASHTKQQVRADGAIKSHPKRTLASNNHLSQQLSQLLEQQQQQLANNKYQAHPFQQQLRQQQAQLIHGIKHPAGQASTISLATHHEGASNTSLAFGAHFIPPQLNPISAGLLETSQLVPDSSQSEPTNNHRDNETTLEPANGGASQMLEQSAYQSQDEILRQVTSAINFEQQQQQQQKRSNHQETVKVDDGQNSMFMTPEGGARLFKAASTQTDGQNSINQSTAAATTTTTGAPPVRASSMSPMELLKAGLSSVGPPVSTESGAPSNSSSSASVANGEQEIDKSYDLLAERMRQLVARQQLLQQQSQNGTSQPSWLRPNLQATNMLGSADRDLSSLLTNLQQRQQGGSGGAGAVSQLDQIRELLSKHEQTKNEIKSSQESMAQLVQQFALLQRASNESQQKAQSAGPQQSPAPSRTEGQSPPDSLSNIGWTPLAKPNAASAQPALQHQQQLPSSSLNPLKNSPRGSTDQQIAISQTADNGNDFANDEHFSKNLALMLAGGLQPEVEHHPHSHSQQQQQQQLIGLPIAFVKDEEEEIELTPGQIEEAARIAAEQYHRQQQHQREREQLGGPIKPPPVQAIRQSNKFVPRLAPNEQIMVQNRLQPEPLNNVQKILQMNSPQTFHAPQLGSSSSSSGQSNQMSNNLPHQIDKMASLIHPDDATHAHMSGAQSFTRANSELMASSGGAHSGPQAANNSPPAQQVADLARLIGENALSADLATAKSTSGGGSDNNNVKNHNGNRDAQSASPSQSQQVSGQDNKLQQQRQQQQQQQQYHEPQRPQFDSGPLVLYPMGEYGQIPRPLGTGLLHDFHPLLHAAGQRPPLISASSGALVRGEPPMKLREVSLYRPFGYRAHHAVSYQASPALSTMFTQLMPSGGGGEGNVGGGSGVLLSGNRPSILRHMSPLRATINESQRLLAPFIPQQLIEKMHHNRQHHYHHHPLHLQHQFPTHNALGQTLPIPPMRAPHYAPIFHHQDDQHLYQPAATYHHESQLARAGGAMVRRHHQLPPVALQKGVATSAKGRDGSREAGMRHLSSPGRMRLRHMEPEKSREAEFEEEQVAVERALAAAAAEATGDGGRGGRVGGSQNEQEEQQHIEEQLNSLSSLEPNNSGKLMRYLQVAVDSDVHDDEGVKQEQLRLMRPQATLGGAERYYLAPRQQMLSPVQLVQERAKRRPVGAAGEHNRAHLLSPVQQMQIDQPSSPLMARPCVTPPTAGPTEAPRTTTALSPMSDQNNSTQQPVLTISLTTTASNDNQSSSPNPPQVEGPQTSATNETVNHQSANGSSSGINTTTTSTTTIASTST